MRSNLGLAAWFGCAFLLLVPASAPAPTVVAESMEWVLATSDRVFLGKVIKIDRVSRRQDPPESGVLPDTARDHKECQAVTVAVSRTLKGSPTERGTFLLPPYIHEDFAKQWMDEGIPLLFCLIKNDGKRTGVPAEKFPWVLRDNGNTGDAVLLGKSKHYWTGCIPVLTRDFGVLKEPGAIVNFVEKTARAAPKGTAPRPHTVKVPGDTAVYKKLWSRSAVFLTVPVDERLEVLGREWCRYESDRPDLRAEGAKTLKHFKNEKNISLLKSLLNDPNTAEGMLHRTVPGKIELELVYRKKLYYVRQAAFDALRELGVKVERPVLEELLEGRDEPDPKSDGRKPRR